MTLSPISTHGSNPKKLKLTRTKTMAITMKIVIVGRRGLENGITHVFFFRGEGGISFIHFFLGGGGDCKDYLLPFS